MSTRLAPSRLHALILAAALSTGFGACATAAPYNPSALSTARLGQVSRICASTVGVKPGFSAHDACIESLSASAVRLDRAGVRQAAHRTCIDRGAAAGATLTACELEAADHAAPAAAAAGDAPAGHPATPFYRASPREVRTREQRACAVLGYDPTSGGFASCVASLDAALYAADHPQP